MLPPIVAAFEWIAPPPGPPFDAEKKLAEALGYCRQVGDGAARGQVRARAFGEGWQTVWEDTSGLDTFEEVEDEIQWSTMDRGGGLRLINVTFYDNPDQDGWRGVCGITIRGFPKGFYGHFLVARKFTRDLSPLAAPSGLTRKQVEALDRGEQVQWFGDRQWRLDFGRFGDENSPWTGVTYFVAGEETTAPK